MCPFKMKLTEKVNAVYMKYGFDARRALLNGINRIADVVGLTLGPGGRNIALDYEAGSPKITKDGVTVAKSISSGRRDEEMGCKLLKSMSGTTNVFSGDGTTSSIMLARELVKESIKAIEYGMHPVDLKHGMVLAQNVIIEELQKISKNLSHDKDSVYQVAMVSSNNDEEISSIISEGLSNLGYKGIFNLDESPTYQSFLEICNGVTYLRGMITEELAFDPATRTSELQNPHILVVGNKIETVKEISSVLEIAKNTKRDLLIFSTDLQEDPLSVQGLNDQIFK